MDENKGEYIFSAHRAGEERKTRDNKVPRETTNSQSSVERISAPKIIEINGVKYVELSAFTSAVENFLDVIEAYKEILIKE